VVIFETPRLILRQIVLEDVDALLEAFGDPGRNCEPWG